MNIFHEDADLLSDLNSTRWKTNRNGFPTTTGGKEVKSFRPRSLKFALFLLPSGHGCESIFDRLLKQVPDHHDAQHHANPGYHQRFDLKANHRA